MFGPSIEELPIQRQTLDDDPRPGAPLWVEHRRLVVTATARLAWCPVGRHYSHHMDYCTKHQQLMLAPQPKGGRAGALFCQFSLADAHPSQRKEPEVYT